MEDAQAAEMLEARFRAFRHKQDFAIRMSGIMKTRPRKCLLVAEKTISMDPPQLLRFLAFQSRLAHSTPPLPVVSRGTTSIPFCQLRSGLIKLLIISLSGVPCHNVRKLTKMSGSIEESLPIGYPKLHRFRGFKRLQSEDSSDFLGLDLDFDGVCGCLLVDDGGRE